MIRDQIVFGVEEDKKVRERLLRETELTCEAATKICHASELSQMHVRTFSEMAGAANVSDGAAVGAVSSQGKWRAQTRSTQRSEEGTFSCKRCGSKHKPQQCPAFGKQCSNCQGQNHFAKQCFSKGNERKKGKSVNIVEDDDLSETFFVGMVNCETEQKEVNAIREDKWIAPLMINGTIITMKLDTGAKANLMSLSDIKAMKDKPQIKKRTQALKDYNGKKINSLGVCILKVTSKGKVHHLLFSVVADGLDSLLSDKACEDLELVKRVYCINTTVSTPNDSINCIVQSYADVFKGFGVLPFTYKIQLKENAQPVVHAARRVPAPLRDRLKKELDRMTMLGVIKKVEEPTDWVNSMVCKEEKW
ncbi:uncharacterized protein LOC117543794 [Gymnodraco acuticeps]|uniref:Uncharacterized protein LOC117543794 n=1 Tax=Gymnodraco acuticeps TaxID=8218 RepID=A0A6P8UA52_GYMAC|nr:uncharacterized protein LOC117543794 [Gymnodraco acuticeps]